MFKTRLSVQTKSDTVLNIMKNCVIQLPDKSTVSINTSAMKCKRIPTSPNTYTYSECKMSFKVVGLNMFAKCTADVLIKTEGVMQDYIIAYELSDDGKVYTKSPVDAIRFVFDLRTPTKPDEPQFVRVTAVVKRSKYINDSLFTSPISNFDVCLDEFSSLGPPGTVSNDEKLLHQVLARSKFIHRANNNTRLNTYMSRCELDKDLPNSVVFVVGEYIAQSYKKYGRRMTKAEQHLVVNLFIHHHLFGRNLVQLVKEFLGIE